MKKISDTKTSWETTNRSCLRELELLGTNFKATVMVEGSEGRERVDPKVSNLVGWVDCDGQVR